MEIVLTTVVVTLGVLFLFRITGSILARLFPRSFEAPPVNAAQAQEEFTRNAERLSTEVRVIADAGYKLDATKRYKEDAGLDLMESKKIIDSYLQSRDQYARVLKAKLH